MIVIVIWAQNKKEWINNHNELLYYVAEWVVSIIDKIHRKLR